jgi:phosphoribosylaminoimidazole-succinocarboxamide synthase
MNTILKTDFKFPGQTKYYKGKVREVYTIDNDLLVMIVSDRISAFDYVLPKGIPFKGQVLNTLAAQFLKDTEDIVPNWVIATPDPNVTIGLACEQYMIEMVIRAYLTGHAWREYKAGKRVLCGVPMPDGMKEHDRFPEPIITPTTKAMEGHDEDITREEILAQNIIPEDEYIQLEAYTRAVFQRGTENALKKGLLLVDTKYEFGRHDGQIYLIDEIHTPDSSRYFFADGYEAGQASGEGQKQLSKEFVREWLIENGFQGLEGQSIPEMPEQFVDDVSSRYIELYEHISGERFARTDNTNIYDRVENNINAFLKTYRQPA